MRLKIVEIDFISLEAAQKRARELNGGELTVTSRYGVLHGAKGTSHEGRYLIVEKDESSPAM